MKKAIYPGSFDPITFGHVDIIKRALEVVDQLVIGISINQEKSPLFTLKEREALVGECFLQDPRIEVISFEGLLIDFAKKMGTSLMIRGLRAASDFDYEFQLASMNRALDNNFETVFLMTGSETYFLSSRLVKEIAKLKGDVTKMVPEHVKKALTKKYLDGHG